MESFMKYHQYSFMNKFLNSFMNPSINAYCIQNLTLIIINDNTTFRCLDQKDKAQKN